MCIYAKISEVESQLSELRQQLNQLRANSPVKIITEFNNQPDFFKLLARRESPESNQLDAAPKESH